MKKTFLLKLFAILLCVLFLSNPALAKNCVSDGIELCAKSLIPSLFPFAVLTGFVFFDGKGLPVPKAVSMPIKAILGIPPSLCPAFLMGIFAGFPMGAAAISLVLKNKCCTKRQAAYTLCLSSLPSPAFVIGYVGQGILGSAKEGLLLLCTLWLCIFPVSIILRITGFGAKEKKNAPKAEILCDTFVQFAPLEAFTHAVKSAALTMLYTSAYVIFFGVLSHFFCPEASGIKSCIISGILELTTGITHAENCNQNLLYTRLLCLALLGFGGICAFLQVVSMFEEEALSFVPYAFSRIYFAFFAFISGLAFLVIPSDNLSISCILPKFSGGGNAPYFVSAIQFVFASAFIYLLYFLILQIFRKCKANADTSTPALTNKKTT